MNGFVQFKLVRDLENFLATPEAAPLYSKGQLSKTASQPLLIFRELNKEDVSKIEAAAKSLGGKIVSSTSPSKRDLGVAHLGVGAPR